MEAPNWQRITFVASAILAILIVWGAFAVGWIAKWTAGASGVADIDKAGQFGDAFGPLNALFSGLAFTGVLATLWMQQRELTGQQEQLRRAEREQHLQRFDSTFFQLLTLLRDLRAEVRLKNPIGPDHMGAEAFRHLYVTSLQRAQVEGEKQTKGAVAASYTADSRMYSENPFGPFFRIVYSILRRISEDSRLTAGDKARYGNLVRSHLSTAEVGLIGLNGLTEDSNDFADFITEFRLLKYLPDNELQKQLKQFYPSETFEPRD